MHAERSGFDLAILRLGIVYGPSPVEHDGPSRRPWSTSSAGSPPRGEPLPLDDGGGATIGVVHVEDAARILLEPRRRPGVAAANVAAETRDGRRRRRARRGRASRARDSPACDASRRRSRTGTASPTTWRAVKFLVTGATGFLGWRTATLLRERGHDVVALARPGGAARAAAADLRRRCASTRASPRRATLVAGCDAVLHFAGVPDPAGARADPADAVRENAGTTVNLLEACLEHGAGARLPVDRAGRASSRRPTPTRSRSASARRPAACTGAARPSCG